MFVYASWQKSEVGNLDDQANDISVLPPAFPIQPAEHSRHHSISISMPSSPSAFDIEQSKRVCSHNDTAVNGIAGQQKPQLISNTPQPPKKSMFYSQPMQATVSQAKSAIPGKSPETPHRIPANNRLRDKRYDSFKTWSGKLERQISNLRGKPLDPADVDCSEITQTDPVPSVNRYFDALEGPELETLKVS